MAREPERHVITWPPLTLGLLFRIVALIIFLLVMLGIHDAGPVHTDAIQWLAAGLFFWLLSSITG